MANIRGECGKESDLIMKKNCAAWVTYDVLQNPDTHETKKGVTGIDLNFHRRWPWQPGEDDTHCVKTAIEKATCHKTISFENDRCYKRGGASLPYVRG
jgi:hypothetical protein